jgi:hypothetical protein
MSSSSADLDVSAGTPGDTQQRVSDARFKAGPQHAEAGVDREAGSQSRSVAKGGGAGMAEGQAESQIDQHDPSMSAHDRLDYEDAMRRPVHAAEGQAETKVEVEGNAGDPTKKK